jgi:hypothetical protein
MVAWDVVNIHQVFATCNKQEDAHSKNVEGAIKEKKVYDKAEGQCGYRAGVGAFYAR